MYNVFKFLATALAIGFTFMAQPMYTADIPVVTVIKPEITEEKPVVEVKTVDKKIERLKSMTIEAKTVEEDLATKEEIELIALVTMAEAEGETEKGKRLVIDTILNRVDHERFPDTISEVIYQPNQFTSMWNGRIDKCYIMNDICELVREELESRTNSDIVFFSAKDYSRYGVPNISEGNHYFSSYD